MNIVITMAGEGSRFRQIGITEPKHLIETRGKTLFEWALLSLRHFYDGHFIFIARKAHDAGPFIATTCRSLGIRHASVIELERLTKGQAETVLAAEKAITNPHDEIMIYNIDTYVEPDHLLPRDVKGDGWIPAFHAAGERWSFVKIEQDFRVIDIAEKVRISDYGTIGLYYFKTYALYRSLYNSHRFSDQIEQYIAPLYAAMIAAPEQSVYAHIIVKEAVHVLGTPEDIQQFDPGFGKR